MFDGSPLAVERQGLAFWVRDKNGVHPDRMNSFIKFVS